MNKAWSCQAKNHSKFNNSKTFISILASFQTIACPINLYMQKKEVCYTNWKSLYNCLEMLVEHLGIRSIEKSKSVIHPRYTVIIRSLESRSNVRISVYN